MLINPESIPVYLIVLGNIIAIIAGLLWVRSSYKLASAFEKPTPPKIQSVFKVITCILSFWLVLLCATHKWF